MEFNFGNDLSMLGRDIGLKIRKEINRMSFEERVGYSSSILKGPKTPYVDVIAEKIALKELHKFGSSRGIKFGVIIDPLKMDVEYIGAGKSLVYSCIDPVDGTIKVAGLGNEHSKMRLSNDGVWGCAASFTEVTDKPIADLKIKDFKYSAIVDGNPRIHSISPDHAYTTVDSNSNILAVEKLERKTRFGNKSDLVKLVTSSQSDQGNGSLLIDDFPAYDRKTARPNAEEMADKLRKLFVNRNDGGFFDIGHIYGTSTEILIQMLAREGIEPQGLARVVINDHYGNTIPAYWIIRGAGGEVTDFKGIDLGEKLLIDHRQDILTSANKAIKNKMLKKLESLYP